MKFFKLTAVLSVIALTGCAAGGRCVGEFEYQKAQTLPPIQGAEGVKAPESGSALRIPPESKQPVNYAERVSDPNNPGKEKIACLDTPPVMPEPAAAKTP